MRDKHDNGNARNTSEDKIVESTHCSEVTIQEMKEIMVRPEVEIKHQNNAKKIRKDETIAKDTSKKDCTNITNHEEIRSQSMKGRVKSPTCANHLTNGKKYWSKDCQEKLPELLVFGQNQNTEDEIRKGIDVTEAGDKV